MSSRLVVLASGNGSNLQAVIDGCRDDAIDASVVGVVTNRPDAFAITRADRAGINSTVLERRPSEERADYDVRLADVVSDHAPDWVVLAGWMRVLTSRFLDRFPHRVVNLHPALPGELPGINAIERAWDEALDGTRTRSGVMVHLVPDEGVDDGPVLATATVTIDAAAPFEEFARTMHDTEHRLLVDTVAGLCARPELIENTP